MNPLRARLWIFAAVAVPALVVVAWLATHNGGSERLDHFWQPILTRQVPIIIGSADVPSTQPISNFLAVLGRSARLRLPAQINFDDLRESSVVLIGPVDRILIPGLRFTAGKCAPGPCITDSKQTREWIAKGADDYFYIARETKPLTGGFLIVATGLTPASNEQAVRMLTRPDVADPILGQLAQKWEDRNVQLVLKCHGSAPPELVATHIW
jgi:hypothetical protein